MEVVITLTMKMKMRMMLRWMMTKNRQKVIASVIGHFLVYVVLKSEGQSNHLIMIIIIIMMMMMMMMIMVTVMIMIMNNNNNPLLTLGSIHSIDASAPEQMSETNNSKETQQGSESQLAGGKPVGYFISMVDDLNSGQQRTNPASGQGGT